MSILQLLFSYIFLDSVFTYFFNKVFEILFVDNTLIGYFFRLMKVLTELLCKV